MHINKVIVVDEKLLEIVQAAQALGHDAKAVEGQQQLPQSRHSVNRGDDFEGVISEV
jgi:hypothetical protein